MLLRLAALVAACLPRGDGWSASGGTNDELVANLARDGRFTDPRVASALRLVDRGHFVPSGLPPYKDSPQRIGQGATISAPHMHAEALQRLAGNLLPGARVLDVGVGSGYLAAAMAAMVGAEGRVVGIDHLEELVDMARVNIRRIQAQLPGGIELRKGDGYSGAPDAAPFDAIHVGAAASHVPPALIEQLRPGGRMLIPVGEAQGQQQLVQVDKGMDGEVRRKELMGVRYVPLVEHSERGTP